MNKNKEEQIQYNIEQEYDKASEIFNSMTWHEGFEWLSQYDDFVDALNDLMSEYFELHYKDLLDE